MNHKPADLRETWTSPTVFRSVLIVASLTTAILTVSSGSRITYKVIDWPCSTAICDLTSASDTSSGRSFNSGSVCYETVEGILVFYESMWFRESISIHILLIALQVRQWRYYTALGAREC